MIQAHPPLSMVKKPQSSPGEQDESAVLRFEEDLLIAPPENTFGIRGSLQDLFEAGGTGTKAAQTELKIYRGPEA